MILSRLIYASVRNQDIPFNVEELLEAAIHNNKAFNITGLLWFNGKYFVQVLEGERRALSTIYGKICNDTRHRDVELISMGAIDKRLFSEWSMGYQGDTPVNRHYSRKYSSYDVVNPYQMTETSLLGLLLDLAEHTPGHNEITGPES